MTELRPVIIDSQNGTYINTEHLSELFFLYLRYSKYLDDDFAAYEKPLYKFFLENIEKLSPYFWIVMDEKLNCPAGFICLDKITGSGKLLHCAEVSACFFKKYWGRFTFETGKKFIKLCFGKMGLKKIKALVYPQNFRVKTLLKKCGFEKEGYLKSETVSRGKLQDIEIYSLISEKIRSEEYQRIL